MVPLDIGLDADGCFYQFTPPLRAWTHLELGVPFDELPDPVTWTGYTDPDQWNLSKEEFLQMYRESVRAGVMFRRGAPYPGSVEVLQRLHACGHRLHIVTDRLVPGAEKEAVESTNAWLTEKEIPYDSLRFSPDKTDPPMDLFLEDRNENYDAIEAAGGFPILMDRPYNASHPGRRVYSWEDFGALVEAIATETVDAFGVTRELVAAAFEQHCEDRSSDPQGQRLAHA